MVSLRKVFMFFQVSAAKQISCLDVTRTQFPIIPGAHNQERGTATLSQCHGNFMDSLF